MKKIILTISLLAFAFLASAQYVPGKPVLGNQNVYGNQWVKDTARIQYVIADSASIDTLNAIVISANTISGKIIYGLNHYDTLSQYISIIGGASDTIVNSDNASIIGSVGCAVKYNNAAVAIEGRDLPSGILFSRNSTVDSVGVIIGSDLCTTRYEGSSFYGWSPIIAGSSQSLSFASDYSGIYSSQSVNLDHNTNAFIIGSEISKILWGRNCGIMGSAYSYISGTQSIRSNQCNIVSGYNDTIDQSYRSVIIASNLCKIDRATNTAIIAAEGITATKNNTLYANNVNVSDTVFHDNFYTVNYSDTLAYGDSLLLCTGVYSPDCWVAVDTAGIPIGKAELVIGSNGALAQTYTPYGCVAVGTLTTNKICVLKWGTSVYIKNNRWKHQRISYQITIR